MCQIAHRLSPTFVLHQVTGGQDLSDLFELVLVDHVWCVDRSICCDSVQHAIETTKSVKEEEVIQESPCVEYTKEPDSSMAMCTYFETAVGGRSCSFRAIILRSRREWPQPE